MLERARLGMKMGQRLETSVLAASASESRLMPPSPTKQKLDTHGATMAGSGSQYLVAHSACQDAPFTVDALSRSQPSVSSPGMDMPDPGSGRRRNAPPNSISPRHVTGSYVPIRGGSVAAETVGVATIAHGSALCAAGTPSPMVKRGRSSEDFRSSPGRSAVYVGTTALGANRRAGIGGSISGPSGAITSQSVAVMPAAAPVAVASVDKMSWSARGNRTRLVGPPGHATSALPSSIAVVAQPSRRTPRGTGSQASPVRPSGMSLSPQNRAATLAAPAKTQFGGRVIRPGGSIVAPTATTGNASVVAAQPCNIAAPTLRGIVIPRLDLQKARH